MIRLSARNPMNKVLLSIAMFEALCAALSIAVMINIDAVAPLVAALAGSGVAALALAGGLMLRQPAIGFPLGWLAQIASIALGVLASGMYFVGGLFAMLWVISFVLGRRLEAAGTPPTA